MGRGWRYEPSKKNLAGFGTYTSAIGAGGETPSVTANTESYNGTTWTEVNNMNTARRALAGSGSQTAGLVYGGTTGSDSTTTESWNGTSWTEVADLATGRLALGGAGHQIHKVLQLVGKTLFKLAQKNLQFQQQ